MKLSTILNESNLNQNYQLYNELEFKTLGLAVSSINNDFCTFLDNIDFVEEITDRAKMIITNQKLFSVLQKKYGKEKGYCIVEEPRIFFFELHNFLAENVAYSRAKHKTIIGDGCKISDLACIAETNVVIGNNVIIEEFVIIRENTVIEDNVIIRAGAKIGGEGFEFKRKSGQIFAVEHLGGVRIEKFVEIQYNTCVDKAVYPWDDTIIGEYSKIDNLVHIGHAVKIGDRTMVVAQSGVGGRTTIGDDVWIGFGSTIRNGISIENKSRVNMGAVVTKSVLSGQAVTGNFAIEHDKFITNIKRVFGGGGDLN